MEPVRIEFLFGGDLNKGVADARKNIRGMQTDVGQTSRSIDNLSRNSQRLLGSIFSIYAARNFTNQLIEIRGEFQSLDIALQSILQSKTAADKVFSETLTLALKSPFRLTELGQATKQLLAYKVSSDEVTETLRRLGDVSAGLSIPLNDLIYLYGTTKIQQRLYTRDLIQFTGRGIDLMSSLAKQFGVADSEVRKLVESGQVGFEHVRVALEEMTNAGGQFANLMEKRMAAVTGQVSILRDEYDKLLNSLGESNEGILYGSIQMATTLVRNSEKIIDVIKVLIATYGTYRAGLILTAVAQGAVTASQLRMVGIISRLTNGIRILNATMAANPYTAAATALAGLVTTLVLFREEIFQTQTAQEKFNATLARSEEQYEAETASIKELVSQASDITELYTDREKALNTLKSKYPDYLNNLTLETIANDDAKEAIEKLTLARKLDIEQQTLAEKRAVLTEKLTRLRNPQPQQSSVYQGVETTTTALPLSQIEDVLTQIALIDLRIKELSSEQKKQTNAEVEARIESIDFLEKEIKKLEEKQKAESDNFTKYQEYQRQILALDEKIRKITGEPSKADTERLEGYKRVREELDDINNDIRLGALADDEQEIERAKIKYVELRELARNNVELLAKIELTQDAEINAIRDAQAKKLFEKQKEAALEAKKEIQDLLNEYQTFDGRRRAANEQYQEDTQKLYSAYLNATNEQEKKQILEAIEVRKEALKGALRDLDAEQSRITLDASEFYKKLFGDVARYGLRTLRQMAQQTNEAIASAQEINEGGKSYVMIDIPALDAEGNAVKKTVTLTIDEFNQLNKQNNEITDQLRQRNPFKALADGYKELIDAIKSGDTGKIDDVMVTIQEATEESIGAVNQFADALKGINEEAGEVIQILGKFASGITNLGAGILSGDPTSIIKGLSSIIEGITAIQNINKQVAKENRQIMRDILSIEQEYQLMLNERIRLQKSAYDNVFIDDFVNSLYQANVALEEANNKYLGLIGIRSDRSGNPILPRGLILDAESQLDNLEKKLSALQVKVKTGGLGQKDTYKSLLGEFPQLIQNGELMVDVAQEIVNTMGKNLPEATRDALTSLIKWKEAAEESEEQINSVIESIAGTLGSDLTSALVDAFKAGEDAAEAFGGSVEKVLESIISQQIFNEIFGGPLQQLQEQIKASAAPGGDLSFQDELEGFFTQYASLTGTFNEQLEAAKDSAEKAGLDIFKSDLNQDQGLSGGIGRAITEDTGKEIVGIFNGLRLINASMKETAEKQLTKVTDSLLILAKIEQNTSYCKKLESIDNRLGRLETDGIKVK